MINVCEIYSDNLIFYFRVKEPDEKKIYEYSTNINK